MDVLYILNDSSVIGDGFSGLLHARYDWQVMVPNMCCSLFLMCHLYVLTCITWKLQVIYGHSTHRTTAVLSNTFLVWFRVAWEVQLESSVPIADTHYSPSPDKTLCAYCKPYIHRYMVHNYCRSRNFCLLNFGNCSKINTQLTLNLIISPKIFSLV